MHAGLSTTALCGIERHLAADGQVLVYINRRGYAPTLACTAWFTAAGLRAGAVTAGDLGDFTFQLLLQVGLAAAVALLVFVPLALIQDAAMDRTGLPPALESP